MMPELGKYATEVLSSYVVSLVLIGVLVAMSVVRARRVKRELADVEGRRNG
ncbi:heme exporter protein D [Sagittula marina]|uniref:Heme exporter protein D n=1 Tax=Sagittula marina TaxID=943940 RepID=A0A7W6DV37_9RHOB|nr:heme exporter protein CcmD [Sagittula marina]MBB3986668.1 heme exporter protein D [Sagittula marina]